jgi:2-haloacid dehalogenase
MKETGDEIDLSAAEVLTFDCYGTLIDWETGIAGALQPVLAAHGTPLERDQLLELYAGVEAEMEQHVPFRSYRTVLGEVVKEIGIRLGWTPSAAECEVLSASLPDWPPFEDTVAALNNLGKNYRLAVISNVDDDLFKGTSRRLEVVFDHVITAQQVRAYKPSISVFERALQIIDVAKESMRATPPADVRPDLEVPDLKSFVSQMVQN